MRPDRLSAEEPDSNAVEADGTVRAGKDEIAGLEPPAPVVERGAEDADDIDVRQFHRQWKGLERPLVVKLGMITLMRQA